MIKYKHLSLVVIGLLVSQVANPADSAGNFAIEGIGGLDCIRFVQAKENKESAYFHFGGWIEGFISASNKHSDRIYDLTPWQTTETIATIVYTACKKQPKANFATVVDGVVGQLSLNALTKESALITLKHGKFEVKVRTKIYHDVELRLRQLKYLDGEANNKKIIEALKKYQSSNNLRVTGLPDQYTLWKILDSKE
ncbi:peptidoglycan-binding domain-containing protein [Alishewanella tabrizica]|uniref:Peptidoglycan binding-like domain-containing protein n=1 Tax=Alishewanella tabrizica TaxID=671278 RepID=A0ABQ2WJ17_9ALTE|nr:peptidoglycan-binding domain-containing protein [Alishewanella tabrizica]GGW57663.1 hypothetical protein GCM10008111_12190 [Alishewanella tabrizica]